MPICLRTGPGRVVPVLSQVLPWLFRMLPFLAAGQCPGPCGKVMPVQLVDAAPSAAPLILPHAKDVPDLAWTPDGLRLVTACGDGRVRFWDAATGKALPLFLQHDREATSCDISPNGQWVATGSHDRTARVWDAVTGQPVSEPMEHPGRVSRCGSRSWPWWGRSSAR